MMARWLTPAIVRVLAASWRRSWKVRGASPSRFANRVKDRVSASGSYAGRTRVVGSSGLGKVWSISRKVSVIGTVRSRPFAGLEGC